MKNSGFWNENSGFVLFFYIFFANAHALFYFKIILKFILKSKIFILFY